METKLNQIFVEAKDLLFTNDIDNILKNVSERNLCGRLAIYLNDKIRENRLDEYFVDVEYNRNLEKPKTILDDEYKVVNITCDIIVHSRGKNILTDNLIAIEMKKSNRPQNEKDADRNRLRALTKKSFDGVWLANGVTLPKHVCGYIIGFYMELNSETKQCLIECYKQGEKVSEWTEVINET
jgi:hypothetical protein